jgi:hypothetical protein
MAGGGIVIIRKSLITTLTHPLVHGSLPQHMQDTVDELAMKDENAWTQAEQHKALAIFVWATMHC